MKIVVRINNEIKMKVTNEKNSFLLNIFSLYINYLSVS